MSDLAPGQILADRYRLDRRLDEGGMSVVWAGVQLSTSKPVALKLLKSESSKDEATRRRMIREARAACAVDHKNVVQIHEVLELPDGSPVLVMDLLTGESLRERLVRRPTLPLSETATLLIPVVSAVGTAHAVGVVHRDLKPDNIYLAQEDGTLVVKVLDFGIAKLMSPEIGSSQINALTNTGTMLGTPYYMAPEQILGESVDHRADIWALGVILYECLTGQRPTEADNVGKILKKVLTNEIQPLSERAPDLPNEVTHLVERMLAQNPKDRPENMREVGEVLEKFSGGMSVGVFGSPTVSPDVDSSERASRPSQPNQSRTVGALAETLIAPQPARKTTPAPDSAARTMATGATLPSRVEREEAPEKPAPKKSWLVFLLGALVVAAAGTGAYFARGKTRSPYLPASASVAVANGQACPSGMVAIVGGPYRMGSDDGKDDERPVHDVTIGHFCLDSTEVTAHAYSDCVARGACQAVESTVNWARISAETRQKESVHCTFYQTEQGTLPMNCVSWHSADAYCKAQQKRLPTEQEWEYAAAGGSERRRFPWGSAAPAGDLTNVCDTACLQLSGDTSQPIFEGDDGAPTLAPVGRYPKGASKFGVLDMAGNVWEWTASAYCTYPEHACASAHKVFRGGGWGGKFTANLRTSARMWSDPSHRYNDVGFRCAKDL
ncbi:MAG: SUMF1/EgtB/PvdO family nonheme iron enzyme [Polyangiaceae bacterium]|nr:SUMF1/EgtB/PvdO family nonheme iron enzyme [Polyangiaceae bacterium]